MCSSARRHVRGFPPLGTDQTPSGSGYHVWHDEKNYLYQYLVDLALSLKPRLFLMENVPGMTVSGSGRGDNVPRGRRARLQRGGGYRTEVWQLTATAFGVGSVAVFFGCVARWSPSASAPRGVPGSPAPEFDLDALPDVRLDEALFGMPPSEAAGGTLSRSSRPPKSKTAAPAGISSSSASCGAGASCTSTRSIPQRA